jgi:hypothetical protein
MIATLKKGWVLRSDGSEIAKHFFGSSQNAAHFPNVATFTRAAKGTANSSMKGTK